MLLVCLLAAMTLGGADLDGENTWTLATADTTLTVQVVDNGLLIRSLKGVGDGHEWCPSPGLVPLLNQAWIGDKPSSLQWVFQSGTWDASRETLTLRFENANPQLALSSRWRARVGRGPVEHWIEIENRSDTPVAVGAQDSLTLAGLAPGAPAALWWIRRGGSNAETQGGTFSELLGANTHLELASNCDDGASPVPWLAVQAEDKRGLYVGWEFSGPGRIDAKAIDSGHGVAVSVGSHPDFKTDVLPGETFLVPPAFVGCYTGDLDEGAYSLHQWILRYLRPPVPGDIPDPTLAYNLYLDAGGPTAREADVLRSAAFCRDLGFETFMPDAMWFPACGDWRWDPARFPAGAGPIETFVHSAGMRMALWCAWSNGGVSGHPDALSVRGAVGKPGWFNAEFARDWQPGPFYGGRICLGSAEAEAWATAKTQWLVGNHGLDYLKHDCGPIVTSCNKTTHRHHYGVDAGYWATMGYYRVQETLRNAYPRLLLENCSGGGHIKDFGIIQRTHYTVTTDTLSNLPDRQSIFDSTYAFPPILLQAYTYERAYKVPGDDPGTYLWRSAMMSAWQIDPTNTRIWTDDERESARVSAEIYKNWIRPMFKDVKVHHVLPRPDGKHWDGLFYWSPGLRQGTLYVFRPDAPEDSMPVRLRGLDGGKSYWVWCEDGGVPAGIRTGAELMGAGLPVNLPGRYTSDLVYLQESALGKPEGLEAPGPFTLGNVEAAADAFHTRTKLTWQPAAGARSYRVTAFPEDSANTPAVGKTVYTPETTLSNLPPDTSWRWKVEAISYGGRRLNEGAEESFKTASLEKIAGVAFVSDMEWTRAQAGADNQVKRDSNYYNRDIAIAGKSYPKGVWTHAFNDATPADVVVALPSGRYGTFAADVGVEDSAGQGSVVFQVLVDGVVRAESPVMHAGQAHAFRVDITICREVTLRVLNAGDGYVCDHAAWGIARFIEAGATDPLQEGMRRRL